MFSDCCTSFVSSTAVQTWTLPMRSHGFPLSIKKKRKEKENVGQCYGMIRYPAFFNWTRSEEANRMIEWVLANVDPRDPKIFVGILGLKTRVKTILEGCQLSDQNREIILFLTHVKKESLWVSERRLWCLDLLLVTVTCPGIGRKWEAVPSSKDMIGNDRTQLVMAEVFFPGVYIFTFKCAAFSI